MNSTFRASIIVPSYNGAHKISGLLDGLIKQRSMDGIELIVVIDGSTDDTHGVLAGYRERFEYFTVTVQENGGRSVARNAGAAIARGKLYIFYDDDMVPSPESVAKHLAFHRENYGILCGDMVEIPGAHKTDIQNYKAWLTSKWTTKYKAVLTRMTVDPLYFTAANCSIPKELFGILDGFDRHLTDAEDYDLAFRALEKEIPVYYDKSNQALHNDMITCRSYIRRQREYSLARRQLKSRLPGKPRSGGALAIARSIVYAAFSFPFWVRLVDSGFFVFLPKALRFRLYSIIIQSLAREYSKVQL